MKALPLASVITTTALLTSPAHSYQSELTIGAAFVESSYQGSDLDSDGEFIAATIYVEPITKIKGPLAEGAFLAKSTSLSAVYVATDSDDAGVESTNWAGNWHWVFSDSDFIFDLSYDHTEYEEDGYEDLAQKWLSVAFGLYVTDQSTMMLRSNRWKVESTDVADSYMIEYQQLFGPENNIKLAAAIERISVEQRFGGEDTTGGYINAIYYPMPTLGLGIGYEKDTLSGGVGAGLDSDVVTLMVDWFIKDNVAITFEYVNGEADEIDIDGFSAGLTFRL